MARESVKGAGVRSVVIHARVAREERDAFRQAAEEIGVTQADLLRWLARAAVQSTPAERRAMRQEIEGAAARAAGKLAGIGGRGDE